MTPDQHATAIDSAFGQPVYSNRLRLAVEAAIQESAAAERERIAVSCQKQRLKRIKDSYDQGWNDALDVIVAALRA